MDGEDISRICNKFCELLKFSSDAYSVNCIETSDVCEIQISTGELLTCSIVVSPKSISILYNGEYDEEKLYTLYFSSSVMLLYYLSVIYYVQITNNQEIGIGYLDLLSILLFDDVDNWRSLFCALCKSIGLGYDETEAGFSVGKYRVSYVDGLLKCNGVELRVDEYSVSKFSEAIFNVVEYLATLFTKQDDLYKNIDLEDPEKVQSNITIEDNDTFEMMPSKDMPDFSEESDTSISNENIEAMDDLLSTDEESSAPVDLSPDFSEPQV